MVQTSKDICNIFVIAGAKEKRQFCRLSIVVVLFAFAFAFVAFVAFGCFGRFVGRFRVLKFVA